MIYDSLDILPIKLYYKISDTGNLKLLTDKEIEEETLNTIWDELVIGFDLLNKSNNSKKIFILNKEINSLEAIHKAVLMACESLSFEYDQYLIDIIKKYGFSFNDNSTEDYHNSIEKTIREAKSLVTKVNMLKNQLPKTEEGEKVSLDEVMASYSSVLGIDFDYNIISCTKFFALKNQVAMKVKSVEKQLQNLKGNGKR